LLHFQACDYDTFVWANGIEVGRHRGGMTPFSCDLTTVAAAGKKSDARRPLRATTRASPCPRQAVVGV